MFTGLDGGRGHDGRTSPNNHSFIEAYLGGFGGDSGEGPSYQIEEDDYGIGGGQIIGESGDACDLSDFDVGRTIISTIHPNTVETRERLVRYFTSLDKGIDYRKPALSVIAATHNDHIHVVHGCSSARLCRCFERIPCFGRRPLCRNGNAFSLSYRETLRKYLGEGAGRKLILWANRLGYGQLYCEEASDDLGLATLNMENNSHLERATGRNATPDLVKCFSTGSQSNPGGSVEHETGVPEEPKFQPLLWVQKRMESEWTTSLQAVLNEPSLTEFQRGRLTFSMPYIKKHIESWKTTEHARTAEWTMDDIYASFEGRIPSFGKHSLQMLDVQDSLTALRSFLFNHFDVNWKSTFLTICKIFDRENGKQNSVCLVGPKSCGKTWFLDGFGKLARFVGTPKNFIKGDTFAWSDCVNCRLLRFDECRIPIQAETWIEKFKEITGGQETMVNRKYEVNAVVDKTPVFMSANSDPFQNNVYERPYFVPDRILMLELYPWPVANQMTQCKMLNPLALCVLKKELETDLE